MSWFTLDSSGKQSRQRVSLASVLVGACVKDTNNICWFDQESPDLQPGNVLRMGTTTGSKMERQRKPLRPVAEPHNDESSASGNSPFILRQSVETSPLCCAKQLKNQRSKMRNN